LPSTRGRVGGVVGQTEEGLFDLHRLQGRLHREQLLAQGVVADALQILCRSPERLFDLAVIVMDPRSLREVIDIVASDFR
jgi:hypothetical protein